MTIMTSQTPAERAAAKVDAQFAGVSMTPAQRQAKIDAIVRAEIHAADFAVRDAAEQTRIADRARQLRADSRAREIARNEY